MMKSLRKLVIASILLLLPALSGAAEPATGLEPNRLQDLIDRKAAVFQAMRSVFNDLLTEIQRSISYFTSIDRAAKIGAIHANAAARRKSRPVAPSRSL